MKKLLFLPAVLLVLAGCTSPVAADPPGQTPSATQSPPAATTTAGQPPAAGSVTCEYSAGGPAAKDVQPPNAADVPATGTVAATMTLNGTPLALTLDREAAPCTVNSFVSLAQQGYFDGTACHRVTDEGIFVLQCGDPSGTGSGGPGYTIPDEFDKITGYPAGALAMANTGQPNSGGSQFFIVYAESLLPPQYTVFGSLDSAGVDAVAKIAAGGNDGSFGAAGGGKPNLPADIESITVG